MDTRIFLLALLFPLSFCNDAQKTKDAKNDVADSATGPRTVKDIVPDLWRADSLQILYYDNPDGDSLRYARFFRYMATDDTTEVNGFLKELNQVFVEHDGVRQCRSEGKLILMKKEEILKTIYFSTRTDTCSYMYFINNGSFIYFPLTASAKNFFRRNQLLAKKPGNF